MSDARRTRAWAYGLTIAGGALIIGGALMMLLFWSIASGTGWTGNWWMPGHGFMFQSGVPFGAFLVWGLFAGAIVLWAGARMRPGGGGDGTTEGVVAIVGSVLSFPAMGGFMFGALLGVVGGALSLSAAAHEEVSDRDEG